MEEKTTGIEIRASDLWSIFKRCWWLMLAVLILVFASMYIFERVTYEEEYTAQAIVWALGSNASASGATSTSDVSIGTQLINDYKQLLLTDDLLQDVINKEVLLITPAQLRGMIDISHETDTRVMKISVTASNPSSAQKLVNKLVDVFCDRINSKNDDANKKLITVWSHATEPIAPSNSVSVVKIGLIAFICAVAVYGVYFVLYIMDDKISTADDVEKYLGVSMLGIIPNRQDVNRKKMKGAYYGYNSGVDTLQSSNQGRNS